MGLGALFFGQFTHAMSCRGHCERFDFTVCLTIVGIFVIAFFDELSAQMYRMLMIYHGASIVFLRTVIV